MNTKIRPKAAEETAVERRGVGRPSTGSALTPAERKARQRARDRKARAVTDWSVEALLSAASQCIQAGNTEGLNAVIGEMKRRAKQARDIQAS